MFLSLSIWSTIVKFCKWSGLIRTQCTCPSSGAQEADIKALADTLWQGSYSPLSCYFMFIQ